MKKFEEENYEDWLLHLVPFARVIIKMKVVYCLRRMLVTCTAHSREQFLLSIYVILVLIPCDLLNKIDSMLHKAHKLGYTTEVINVMDMLQNAYN